jgi:ABC-type lipoprotein release transport system permease subunit
MGIAALPLETSVVVAGVPIAALLALASAMPPTWRALRLNVVDALGGR